MYTKKCQNWIGAGPLSINSVDCRSFMSYVVLINIHPLPFEYGINALLRVILNGMQDLSDFSRITFERTCTLHIFLSYDAWTFSIARRPLFRFPLIKQHKERRRLLYTERQSWMQEWYNVVFSKVSRFCVAVIGRPYTGLEAPRKSYTACLHSIST